MRPKFLAIGLPALLGLACAVVAVAKEPATVGAAADPLIVHEWGTFTSIQGADGIVLEGVGHEEEPLPAFVYSRAKVRECPLRAYGYKGLEVEAEHVTQKMETPVLYFHTKTPRHVRVRVDFERGLISQWYPVTDLLGPAEGARDAGPLDLSKIDRSFLEWDVDLLPREGPAPAEIPAVVAGEPWTLARQVDAAWVRTVPRKGPERMGPTEAEHYLFYRGLGTFTLPMKATFAEGGGLSFENGSAHGVAEVFAIEVREGGREGRYGFANDVRPGSVAHDLLKGLPFVAWPERGVWGLKDEVEKILVGHGMARDEARAMVATWSRSWFSSEGTRILYVVPRPLVDALLPLRIDPKPDAIERVLLGRIECIPPAVQAEVEKALVDRVAGYAPARDAAEARLARLGRFLEPHLRRVVATAKDPAAAKAAAVLLSATKESTR